MNAASNQERSCMHKNIFRIKNLKSQCLLVELQQNVYLSAKYVAYIFSSRECCVFSRVISLLLLCAVRVPTKQGRESEPTRGIVQVYMLEFALLLFKSVKSATCEVACFRTY